MQNLSESRVVVGEQEQSEHDDHLSRKVDDNTQLEHSTTVIEVKKKKKVNQQKQVANQNMNRMLSVYLKNPDMLAEEERLVKARMIKKRKAEEAERELMQKLLIEKQQVALTIAEEATKDESQLAKSQKQRKKKKKDQAENVEPITEQLKQLEKRKQEINGEILKNSARFPASSTSSNTNRTDMTNSEVQKQRKNYRISDPQPVRGEGLMTRSTKQLLPLKETSKQQDTILAIQSSSKIIHSKIQKSNDNSNEIQGSQIVNEAPSNESNQQASRYFLHRPHSRTSQTNELSREDRVDVSKRSFSGKLIEDTLQKEDRKESYDMKRILLTTLQAQQKNEGEVNEKQEPNRKPEDCKQEAHTRISTRLTQSTEASKLKVKKPRSPSATPQQATVATNPNVNMEIIERQKAHLEKMKEKQKKEKEEEDKLKQKEQSAREKLKITVLSEVRQTLKEEEIANEKAQKLMSSTTLNPAVAPFKKRRASLTQLPKSNEDEKENGNVLIGRRTRALPNVRNLAEWKKKQRLPDATKVFIIKGGYGDLKRALLHRGWVENPQTDSPCFNLKFTLMGKDINYDEIEPYQIVNHFEKNHHLSTKAGLLRSLRNLQWSLSKDPSAFFPECYYLNETDDMTQFIQSFKLSKALSILKKFVRVNSQSQAASISQKDFAVTPKQKNKKNETSNIEQQKAILRIQAEHALTLLARHSQDVNNIIDDGKVVQQYFGRISEEDWKILQSSDISVLNEFNKKKDPKWISKLKQILPCSNNKGSSTKSINTVPKSPSHSQNQPTSLTQTPSEDSQSDNQNTASLSEDSDFLQLATSYLNYQKKTDRQYDLKGEDNIWILKPAGLSRGRGITCHSDLNEIQELIKQSEVQMHLVIQKYIENPLLVHSRKFDIRAWVVITEWNPMQIWYFDDCYVRFSADSYTTDNLSNAFQHLTNNAISKNKKNEGDADSNHPITRQGNMYTQKQLEAFFQVGIINKLIIFSSYFLCKIHQEREGYNVFQDKIKPAMMDVIRSTILGCQDVEPRRNSFELFGFDIMIDEKYTPWLLEVNTSPCMEYSTEITEMLVKAVFEDLPKIIIDNRRTTSSNSPVDTGKFVSIYCGQEIMQKQIAPMTTQLICEGTKSKLFRNPKSKVFNEVQTDSTHAKQDPTTTNL